MSFAIGLLLFLAGLIITANYLAPFLWRLFSVNRLRSKAKGSLVLTFDDGPGPELTKHLCELLEREGVLATFFLTGFRVDIRPDLAIDLALRGHEIGSHSRHHLNAWRHPYQSLLDTRTGLMDARRVSPDARLYRPPYGKATLWTHLLCWHFGFRVAYWTIDCKDAETHTIRTVDDINRQIISDGGGVVLLHDLDIDPHVFPGRQERVLEVCRGLIHMARENGFRITQLGKIM